MPPDSSVSHERNGSGYEALRIAGDNCKSCRSLCPAKAAQVFAGLSNVDFYGILQFPLVSCKVRAFLSKAPFPRLFSLPSGFFPHPPSEKNRSFTRDYALASQGTFAGCYACKGAFSDCQRNLRPRCRSPPLLKFDFSQIQKNGGTPYGEI